MVATPPSLERADKLGSPAISEEYFGDQGGPVSTEIPELREPVSTQSPNRLATHKHEAPVTRSPRPGGPRLPFSVSAAECTDAQIDELDALESITTKVNQCPGYDDFVSKANATVMAAPCKDAACMAEPKKYVAWAPVCLTNGVSIKKLMGTRLEICVGLNNGSITVDKATEMNNALAKSFEDAMNAMVDEDARHGSSAGKSNDTVTKAPANASVPGESSSLPSPSATGVPMPAATSGASAMAATALLATGVIVLSVLV